MNETRDTLRRLRIYVLIIVALLVWGGSAPHLRPAVHHPAPAASPR